MKRLTRLAVMNLIACATWAQQPGPEGRRMPPEMRKKGQEWAQKMGRGEGKLQPGDPAPDFELRLLHSRQTWRLSQFRGKKPVALVFASYT